MGSPREASPGLAEGLDSPHEASPGLTEGLDSPHEASPGLTGGLDSPCEVSPGFAEGLDSPLPRTVNGIYFKKQIIYDIPQSGLAAPLTTLFRMTCNLSKTEKYVSNEVRTRDLNNKVEHHILLSIKNKKTINNIFFSI
jgi:hypothetical protein